MRSPRAAARVWRWGRCGRAAALLALYGLLFSVATPGVALVNVAGQVLAVDGALAAYVCHAQGATDPAGPDGSPSSSDECCLICQAAQLANGAMPPQHFTLPTESAAAIRLSACAQDRREGTATGHAQARAPPAA